MKFKINVELLPMKAHYFFFFAGIAPVLPFMPTLIRQLGFSSFIVGTIYSVCTVVGLLFKPIVVSISDRFRQQRLLFLSFQIFTGCAFFAINFIPQLDYNASVSFHCNNNTSDFSYCPNGTASACLVSDLIRGNRDNTTNRLFTCDLTCKVPDKWMLDFICDKWQNNTSCHSNRKEFKIQTTNDLNRIVKDRTDKTFCLLFENKKAMMIDGDTKHPILCPALDNMSQYVKVECEGRCNNDLTMRTITETKINNSSVGEVIEFWLLLLFLTFAWTGKVVVVSLGDAVCFSVLGERSHLYGKQRLWGSIGWGVFAVIAGFCIDVFSGTEGNKNYTVVFYMVLILLGFDFWFSLKIKNVQTHRSTSIMKDVGILLFSLPVIIFFIWCIIIGLCTALIWNFLFWHLEDLADQGCTKTTWMKTLQGLVLAIQCFGGELPFFFISGWILKKIGHINAMTLVLIGYSVRFLLYSALSNPWLVLPIELLQGITFGLFYSTMTSYASIVAPIGTESTLQGLVGVIFAGVGLSMGSFIGGIIYEQLGGSTTFLVYGIVLLVFCAIHVRLQKMLQKHSNGNDSLCFSVFYTPEHALHRLEDDVRQTEKESTNYS